MSKVVLKEAQLKRIIKDTVHECVRRIQEDINDNSVQYWTEIRFVQGTDDDYNEVTDMFDGEGNDWHCDANSQPVIDYLSQWDDGEGFEVKTEYPRIARGDTSYQDESGRGYTLLYNSSVGGCFLLIRPSTEDEIDWYNNRR